MKKIVASTTLLLLFTSCGQQEIVLQKYYSSRVAKESQIDIKESYVGYVQSDITTALSSEVGGEILSMPVKVWQTIKVGDTVASINVDTSNVAYQWWQGVLESLESMKESISESFDTQMSLTRSQLKQAQIELEASKIALNDAVNVHTKQTDAVSSGLKVTQVALDTTIAEKEQVENVFRTKESTLYSNAKDALTAMMIVQTNINTYVDEVFGLTKENDYKNNEYYQFLGAKDDGLKEATKIEAGQIRTKFLALKDIYEKKIHIVGIPQNADIDMALTQTIDFSDELKTFLSDMYDVFDASIENVPTFSTQIIEWHKAKILGFGQQIEQLLISISGDMLLWVKGTLQSLEWLSDEKLKALTLLDKKIELAQSSLTDAERNADITPANQQSQIHQQETSVTLAQEKIQQIEDGLKNLESAKKARLDEIRSQIAQTQAQSNIQKLTIGKWVITSPISWVVTKKMADIGTVVWPGQQLVEVSDTSSKKMLIELSGESLSKIQVWNEVQLLFDGKDTLVWGKISLIYPFQDEKTRKTRVEIRSPELAKIPLWSRAKVFLSKPSSKGVTIPRKAIIDSFSIPGVYLIVNKKILFTHIEIIDQNEDVAIVKWVPVGSNVIVLWKENMFDGEDVTNYKKLPE